MAASNKCTGCKSYFPRDQMIIVTAGKFHSEQCKFDYAIKQTDKLIEKARAAKKKVNSRQKSEYYDNNKPHQLNKAITACNRYIVARDGRICISCRTTKPGIVYSAGHYKTAGGYPELRFHPDNIHSQCLFNCNKNKSGNIVEYRPWLLKKIGADRLAYIEGHHKYQGYTIDDYVGIQHYYKELMKMIQCG